MKDLGITVPSWQNDQYEGDMPRRRQNKANEAHTSRLLAQVGKKHEIKEFTEGVWFEPIKALLKRKPSHSWTTRQHKQGRGSSVERGRRKRPYDMNWADSEIL